IASRISIATSLQNTQALSTSPGSSLNLWSQTGLAACGVEWWHGGMAYPHAPAVPAQRPTEDTGPVVRQVVGHDSHVRVLVDYTCPDSAEGRAVGAGNSHARTWSVTALSRASLIFSL